MCTSRPAAVALYTCDFIPNKVVQLCVRRVLQLSPCTRVMSSPNKVVQLCVRRVLQLSPRTSVMSSQHTAYLTCEALSDCSYACMSGGVFRLHRPRRRPCTSLQ